MGSARYAETFQKDLAVGAPLTDVLIQGSTRRLYPRAGDVSVFYSSNAGLRLGHYWRSSNHSRDKNREQHECEPSCKKFLVVL